VRELTDLIFYQVACQLLGFVHGVDYTDLMDFVEKSNFPVIYGDIIDNIYQQLDNSTKSGNTNKEQKVN
ncbi:hypothetical protein ACJBXQ_11600, partial [Streptococcus suis]